ncbi:xanthine dehydrogenase family protein subunit M [Neobacillus sp. PS3-34]|uniref:FAD binding domain-containing protein n=1 Tax=Neobacillus sp. PS3-34 TaxID=3070678 RepID=UPI0035A658DE
MLVTEIDMVSPASITECLTLISKFGSDYRLIAGGTDAVVRMKEGKWRPKVWVNIKGLQELRYITEKEGAIHIGPLTTHTDIVKSPLLQKRPTFLSKQLVK